MNALRVVLSSSRPISWVNTAFPFGLAYLVNGGGLDWLFYIGVFFFLIPYNVAMYGINDVFDYESDIRNPRKGGVEGAVVAKKHHSTLLWAAVMSTLPFLVVLYAAGNWVSSVWLTVSMAAVVAYSAPVLRFKERPFIDSLTSSAHFTTPALVGATITGHAPDGAFWTAITAFFLWGAASQILGAVQDVRADAEAGLSSIATAVGARTALRLSVLLYLASSVLVFLLPGPSWAVGLAAVAYAVNAARFWNVSDLDCEKTHHGWVVFLILNYITGAIISITMATVLLPSL